jgi:hypothetical protein
MRWLARLVRLVFASEVFPLCADGTLSPAWGVGRRFMEGLVAHPGGRVPPFGP